MSVITLTSKRKRKVLLGERFEIENLNITGTKKWIESRRREEEK